MKGPEECFQVLQEFRHLRTAASFVKCSRRWCRCESLRFWTMLAGRWSADATQMGGIAPFPVASMRPGADRAGGSRRHFLSLQPAGHLAASRLLAPPTSRNSASCSGTPWAHKGPVRRSTFWTTQR